MNPTLLLTFTLQSIERVAKGFFGPLEGECPMINLKSASYLLFFTLFTISALTPQVSVAQAFIEPILLGSDPRGDEKGGPATVDILAVFLTNNGTHFTFVIKCRVGPEPSGVRAYCIYLDTKGGGATYGTYKGADYCLQGGGASGLYEWILGNWTYKSAIDVQLIGNSIYLTASLSDIGYPGNVKEGIGVVAATYQPLHMLRDRAPDKCHYLVAHKVIPELPGLTLFIFIPVVLTTVYMIRSRRFKQH